MFDKTQGNFVNLIAIFAEHTRQIIFWTGAGLSAPAKLPTWPALRDGLLQTASKLFTDVNYQPLELRHKKALLELARTEPTLWKSFSHLREALEETTYAETIRTIFRSAETCNVPAGYHKLTSLNPRGIITTNLDRLVTKAVSEVRRPASPIPLDFCGRDCTDYLYALNSTRLFILNLHGIIEKRQSWVLTREDLTALLTDESYNRFLLGCFVGKTVVFVGATVDDVSITAHLDKVRRDDGTAHFWLTTDRSQKTRQFCEKYHILPIYYSEKDEHAELATVCDLLREHRSHDEEISQPVVPPHPTTERSVRNFDDIDLDALPLNELRRLLNRKAQTILAAETEQAYENYKAFRQKYAKFIHNSWFVEVPDNDLCGFKLKGEIGDGAFGRVFEATDVKGATVAVKLLKADVMRRDGWLQAFRRGVRAMQILNARKVEGMVQYISASEIPTFVAMEYIDGVDLRKAIEDQQVTDWDSILKVLCEVSAIIEKAHGLPERVLHRDIRPANIMLKGFDYSSTEWSICVLDFDLAFHKGANEQSIQHSSDTNGFLAPEQLDRASKFTTRSALVDSYGMGMLCYYMIARKMPQPEESLHRDWPQSLQANVSGKACREWTSLPFRMARLIERCTRRNQAQRLDMTQIHGYLSALRTALRREGRVNDGELLADEIAARTALRLDQIENLTWNSDRCEGRIHRNSGEIILIRPDGANLNISLLWNNDGNVRFEDVRTTLVERVNAARGRFSRQGFVNVVTSLEGKGANVNVVVDNRLAWSGMDRLVDVLSSTKLAPKVY